MLDILDKVIPANDKLKHFYFGFFLSILGGIIFKLGGSVHLVWLLPAIVGINDFLPGLKSGVSHLDPRTQWYGS